MERLFLECTLRAALLVGGAAIVLYVMRVKPAAARYRVWRGAMALMLILPIWTLWGPKVPLRILPALPQITANDTTVPSGIMPTSLTASPAISTREAVLLGIYLLGLCVFLIRLTIGTLRAGKLAREAVVHDRVRTSPFCVAPVTVGFFHPVVILPEQWRQWPQAQVDAILTHEGEHARRRDPLVQWFALLNRAIFWFHPAAWWLERTLSALAEQACDDAVLEHGHNPRDYAQYLIDIARSMARSGARVNLAGMTMPGTFLARRIRKILEADRTFRISRARMACAFVVCWIACTACAAGRIDHSPQNSSSQQPTTPSLPQPSTKFVLGDLKIEGDVQDRDAARDRVLNHFNGHEYRDARQLADVVMEVGVRADFQNRGYFKVIADVVGTQPLGIADGKQRTLLIVSVNEGAQYRFERLVVKAADASTSIIPPPEVVQGLVHLRRGDLFDAGELRDAFGRLEQWYAAHGYGTPEIRPEFTFDDTHHLIDVTLDVK